MAGVDFMPLLERLEDDVDDLEEALEPLLATALSTTTSKLPVLDKAKLYVLLTYTVESLLFSYARLNGVDAKKTPVFKELTRVKQYFEKIKEAEDGPTKRENMSLNKQAAGRVIKHALAGNDRYDLERAEREAREKAQAQLKLARLNQQANLPHKRPAKDISEESEEESSSDSSHNSAPRSSPPKAQPPMASASESSQTLDSTPRHPHSFQQEPETQRGGSNSEAGGARVGRKPRPKKRERMAKRQRDS